MKIHELKPFLKSAIENGLKILIKGSPGIGKTELIREIGAEIGAEIVVWIASVSDPTDLKGLPANVKGNAEFLPYGDLRKLIEAKHTTLCFFDDIGQATPNVQAAIMHLIQAREIGSVKISDKVVFVGATNDVGQMAGVSGLMEPLKSRWDTIVTMESDIASWSAWARKAGVPPELIAYLNFQPAALCEFIPTKQLTNSPNPRTWNSVAKWMQLGVRNLEIFVGAVGQSQAVQAIAFFDLLGKLPPLADIIAAPMSATIPHELNLKYAIVAGLSRLTSPKTISPILQFLGRLPKEFEVFGVQLCFSQCPKIADETAFRDWSVNNSKFLL